MRYYHIAIGPPRGPGLPVCRVGDAYAVCAQGVPADVPTTRLSALAPLLLAHPDWTEVCMTPLPDDVVPAALITARTTTALDLDCPAPVRCRCGAVAIVREVVQWRSPQGPAQRVVEVCTGCFSEEQETARGPDAPQEAKRGRFDAQTIIDDWQTTTHKEPV